VPIFQVDAFADRPFAGNPAAVCLLPGPRDAQWMQQVAMEMNLAETAFLHQEGDGYRLRWFTPTVEVDLCGHATLASAHILWEQNLIASDAQARFQTRSGLLTADRRPNGIELDFPATPVTTTQLPLGLIAALGLTPRFTGKSRFDYFIEADSEDTVRRLQPDHGALAELDVRGLIVTAKAETPGFDFISRFFAPGVGIPEDPATGSSHCALAPFWSERLKKQEMTGYQASARGGVIGVRLVGERVRLRGKAVTVLRGELMAQ
jgi:predicted PhzF superfamily epimerase YddE/YHI9